MRFRKSHCCFANRPSLHQRRGYTLIQLMVAISVSGVLMGMAATWIHQALHFNSSIRQRQRHHTEMLRLADQLRDDVRISTMMSLPNEDELLLKSAGGTETRYVLGSGWVSVEKKRNADVLRRDRFELAPNAIAQWQSGEKPDWLTLVVFRGRIGVGKDSSRDENAGVGWEPVPIDLHVRVGVKRWSELIEK